MTMILPVREGMSVSGSNKAEENGNMLSVVTIDALARGGSRKVKAVNVISTLLEKTLRPADTKYSRARAIK